MRFAPVSAALSIALAATASVGLRAEEPIDPRAQTLLANGRAALAAGETQAAVDAFEAALTIDPGHTPILIDLAAAARSDGLQGKALRYYREARQRDPGNLAAIAGEGAALVEKGAVEKARRNLAQLESLCGNCGEARRLETVIAAGPTRRVVRAEAVLPEAEVVEVN